MAEASCTEFHIAVCDDLHCDREQIVQMTRRIMEQQGISCDIASFDSGRHCLTPFSADSSSICCILLCLYMVLSQFFCEGGVTREHSYTVQTYAKHFLAKYEDAATGNLITAMLHYSTASQLHFGYNTDKLANAELETPDYSNVTIDVFKPVAGQGTELAKLYSASLILKSGTWKPEINVVRYGVVDIVSTSQVLEEDELPPWVVR